MKKETFSRKADRGKNKNKTPENRRVQAAIVLVVREDKRRNRGMFRKLPRTRLPAESPGKKKL